VNGGVQRVLPFSELPFFCCCWFDPARSIGVICLLAHHSRATVLAYSWHPGVGYIHKWIGPGISGDYFLGLGKAIWGNILLFVCFAPKGILFMCVHDL